MLFNLTLFQEILISIVLRTEIEILTTDFKIITYRNNNYYNDEH